MDPQLPTLVGTVAAILAIGIVLRRFHQPHVPARIRFVRALLPKDLDLPGGRRSNRERAAADTTEPATA